MQKINDAYAVINSNVTMLAKIHDYWRASHIIFDKRHDRLSLTARWLNEEYRHFSRTVFYKYLDRTFHA